MRRFPAQGRLLDGIDLADIHGQDKFNFRHAAISRDDSKRFLDWAFWRDFERNGPSLYRMCETMLQGWRRYKNYPDLRVRERFERENAKLRTAYSAALWAAERYFRKVNGDVSRQIHELRREIGKEFGAMSRHCREPRRTGALVDDAARRPAAGSRRHLRAANNSRAPQLDVRRRSTL